MENSKTITETSPSQNSEYKSQPIKESTNFKSHLSEKTIPFSEYLESNLINQKFPEEKTKLENQIEQIDLSDWIESLNGSVIPLYLPLINTQEEKTQLIYTNNSQLNSLEDNIQLTVNSKNSSLNLQMPAGEPIEQLLIQYDSINSSISAEIIGSEKAVAILNSQLQSLRDNLAKHNIKIKNLTVQSVSSQSNNQNKRKGKN